LWWLFAVVPAIAACGSGPGPGAAPPDGATQPDGATPLADGATDTEVPPSDAAGEAPPPDAAKEVISCLSLDSSCDGVDDDCDGMVDDDYVPRVPDCPAGQCPAAATSCTGGVEAVACRACVVPARVEGNWLFYHHAVDFDVAAGKLCFIPSVAGAGPLGGVTCTMSPGGPEALYVPVPTPPEFSEGCGIDHCNSRVSLDARGRIWGTRPDTVYAATDAGPLVRIAGKPPGCESEGVGITAIEVTGPTDADPRVRPFVICSAIGGSVASMGSVHELVPAENRWIDLGFSANAISASPSRDHEVFVGAPAPTGGVGYFRFGAGGALDFLGRIGSGIYAVVGGVYMAAQAPFSGGVSQWNGTEIVAASDFTLPLPMEDRYFGRYRRLATAGTSTPFALPYKLVEGGGPGVGGPSPPGFVDVMWILNETWRVQAYNLAPVPDGAAGPLDQVPLTAIRGRFPPSAPVAVCHDAELTEAVGCSAEVTLGMINGGSYDPDGGTLSFSMHPPGPFPAGTTVVTLTVSDGSSSASCRATITVVDAAPPVLAPAPPVLARACPGGAIITITPPAATDNCTAAPAITGRVIAADGASLPEPIPVVAGRVRLSPGSYVVEWTASDGVNTSDPVAQTVAVAPTLTIPRDVRAEVCGTHGDVGVGQATGAAECSVTLAGRVIASNGSPPASAIDVVAGRADLGLGTHIVLWTASEGADARTIGEWRQTVIVGPKTAAHGSFLLSPGAVVARGVVNLGEGETRIAGGARAGGILSVGPVTVLDGALVSGAVAARGAVFIAAAATTGPVSRLPELALPAPPSLPPFPPAGGDPFVLSTGSRSLAPGSHGATTLIYGTTLVLGSGDYFFDSLDIGPSVRVVTAPDTRVMVRGALTFVSPFIAPDGAVRPIFLGLGTAGGVRLDAPFHGTLVAPQAHVLFGGVTATENRGSFHAAVLELGAGSSSSCD
jgi:hypothetical protein